MTCANCGSSDLPLGRPRKDGSRWPMHYCRACLSDRVMHGTPLVGGGQEAMMRTRRSYRRRAAAHIRVVLGPCPCHQCGSSLVYMGRRWVDAASGNGHNCAGITPFNGKSFTQSIVA